ncbi:UNVERIFIED_CONTAM: hypothetical protein K2H54_071906 [Gekko kuhli]
MMPLLPPSSSARFGGDRSKGEAIHSYTNLGHGVQRKHTRMHTALCKLHATLDTRKALGEGFSVMCKFCGTGVSIPGEVLQRLCSYQGLHRHVREANSYVGPRPWSSLGGPRQVTSSQPHLPHRMAAGASTRNSATETMCTVSTCL